MYTRRNKSKRPYKQVEIKKIEVDKRISITMTSPPGDPPTPKYAGDNSPFK